MWKKKQSQGYPKKGGRAKMGGRKEGICGQGTRGREVGQTLLRRRPLICPFLHSQQSTVTGKSPSLVSLPPPVSRWGH